MAPGTCEPCDCISGALTKDEFLQYVIILLCRLVNGATGANFSVHVASQGVGVQATPSEFVGFSGQNITLQVTPVGGATNWVVFVDVDVTGNGNLAPALMITEADGISGAVKSVGNLSVTKARWRVASVTGGTVAIDMMGSNS